MPGDSHRRQEHVIGARGNFLNFLDLRRHGSGGSQPDSSLTSGVCEVARALSPKVLCRGLRVQLKILGLLFSTKFRKFPLAPILERITCGRACRTPYCCAVLLRRLIRRSGGDSIRRTSSKAQSTRCRYREARISHRCSSRGRRGAVRSGAYDPRGADSYLTVRGAPRGEKTPLSAVHRRPQQKTGEICGLVHDQDTCLDVAPETEE